MHTTVMLTYEWDSHRMFAWADIQQRFDWVRHSYWHPLSLQLLLYQQRVLGLCWSSLVDFPCWFLLKINIFSGPLQSSYFPGLIDDNGKLQGFVETLPSNPFTLCKINLGLLTRSWLNLVQKISLNIILACGHASMDPPQETFLSRTVWQGDI